MRGRQVFQGEGSFYDLNPPRPFAILAVPQFVPQVTELVVAQCVYLEGDEKNRNIPIYVYLNSTGCHNEQGQALSSDYEFFAMWAALGFTRAPIYTGHPSHTNNIGIAVPSGIVYISSAICEADVQVQPVKLML
jgi:ATP-dependent protease ClpP protease subunit